MNKTEKRLLLLIKALIYGYRYTCKNGMVIGMDEAYHPYLVGKDFNNKDVLLHALFEFDLHWLSKEANYMTEEKEFEIISWLGLNKEKIERLKIESTEECVG